MTADLMDRVRWLERAKDLMNNGAPVDSWAVWMFLLIAYQPDPLPRPE